MRSFLWAAGGTGFTFIMTALGAALVFFFRNQISPWANRLCMGFSGGVMSAAAVFSLLLPAMEQAQGGAPWLTAALGFAFGAGVMILLDMLLRIRTKRQTVDDADRKRLLLFSAVTLHNIPEGMAVGLAFAMAAQGGAAGLAGAITVALGIGIQNFPEGAALSLPLRQSGMSRRRSFALGALSGAVEPVSGVLTALAAVTIQPVMPWLMAFAAGAMMWVVFSEMLPAAGEGRDGALAAVLGYLIMMALDVALG